MAGVVHTQYCAFVIYVSITECHYAHRECCLQVASEDTVLYTAQRYVNALKDRQHREAARQQLAPLIRCQHLSPFWFSAAAVSSAPNLLLIQQQAQLRQLLMLRQAYPTIELSAAQLEELLPGSPSSWGLSQRVNKEVSNVQLVWNVDIEEIRAAARSSVNQPKIISLFSECAPPLGGVAFRPVLDVEWDAAKGGSTVDLSAVPQNVPQDAFYTYSFSLSVPKGSPKHACFITESGTSPVQKGGGRGYGIEDFFDLRVMVGGSDEAAWAAQGLPTSGQLPITLTVHRVDDRHDQAAQSGTC